MDRGIYTLYYPTKINTAFHLNCNAYDIKKIQLRGHTCYSNHAWIIDLLSDLLHNTSQLVLITINHIQTCNVLLSKKVGHS